MFQKREKAQDTVQTPSIAGEPQSEQQQKGHRNVFAAREDNSRVDRQSNTVLRGSRITGDIRISCDIDISGDVHGNITADTDAHVNIGGVCVGNIKTGGDVVISGELKDGDILSGGTVTISGTYRGGIIRANKVIHIDGEFSGKLESKEVRIGPKAVGKGEIVYQEHVSVTRGARIEGTILCAQIPEIDRKDILLLPRKGDASNSVASACRSETPRT